MKKTIGVIFVLLMTQLAHARPYLNGFKGHIQTNDPELDLSQLRVKQTIICFGGWGDSAGKCGEKKTEALVNAKGDFELPGVTGESRKWFRAEYAIFYKGKILFYRAFEVAKDKKNVQKLLSNFTIFIVKPFRANFVTDTGVDFSEWRKNENNNKPVGMSLKIESPAIEAFQWLLPERQFFHEAIEENNSLITFKPQMLPGPAQGVLTYTVESKFLGGSSSVDISKKQINLNDENLIEKLSSTVLKTQLIDYSVNGLWSLDLLFSFHEGRYYFQYADPSIYLTSKCENGILSGTVYLDYVDSPKNNQTQDLHGTCAKGTADFDLSLMATNYRAPTDQRNFNLRFHIFNIAAGAGEVKVTDLGTQEIYATRESIARCLKFRRDGKYLVCERK